MGSADCEVAGVAVNEMCVRRGLAGWVAGLGEYAFMQILVYYVRDDIRNGLSRTFLLDVGQGMCTD